MAQVQRVSFLGLVLLVAALTLLSVSEVDARLSFTYYRKSCPRVESIIFKEVQKAFKKDPTIAPGLLRMVFHDCFVRGCDASVLLAGKNTERASIRNNRLHGIGVIDTIKAVLEKACPRTVSCADILVYASRDTVVLTGGTRWRVFGGRRDGRVSNKVEVEQNVPPGTARFGELVGTFAQKGLSPQQMVDLSGSHTLGVTHCEHIANRIFTPVDRSLPRDLLLKLRKTCPKRNTATPIVLDQRSVHKFDTAYFQNVRAGRGIMTSDKELYNPDSNLRQYVNANLNQRTFSQRFGAAMFAMSNIEPLEAPEGEIRRRCQFRN